MKTLKALGALFLLAGVARADEVFLKNGGRLEGIARSDGDRVIVEMKAGSVTLRAADVAEVVRRTTPLDEYAARLARVQSNPNARAYFDLALWAKSQGLSRYVSGLLERAIALEPGHEGARKLLGQVSRDDDRLTARERGAASAAEEACKARERAAALVRRKESARPIEETPYTLGIRVLPRRGSQVHSGGYPFWGGAWYFHGPRAYVQSLVPVPLRHRRQ